MYRVLVLLIVGWRGYGGPPNDAPEHWIMGQKTTEILELLGIPYRVLEEGNLAGSLDYLEAQMTQQSVPSALLVRSGVIE